ncbi:hypothetical protein OG786_01285 [Streptomyces sp. NBC_00101]|uniref:hypothetical protein n=1 Tax=Streptomyces sp. NBC_00101 TaxID=2975651 RepID=UPI00324B448A
MPEGAVRSPRHRRHRPAPRSRGNRRLWPRLLSEDDDTGTAVRDPVGPLLTLTVLLLACVLVTAYRLELRALLGEDTTVCLPRRSPEDRCPRRCQQAGVRDHNRVNPGTADLRTRRDR